MFAASTIIFLVSLVPTVQSSTEVHVPYGDYTGWAYDPGGGDFPLRLKSVVVQDENKISVVFPHLDFLELKAENSHKEGNTITLKCRTSTNQLWTFQMKLGEDSLTGEATVDGGEVEFTFNVTRSSLPLKSSRLENPEQYTGVYKSDSGHAVIVSSWSWGELKLTDTSDGRVGTLLQESDEEFLIGPTLYQATPVHSKIGFRRSKSDEIDSILLTHSDGSSETLRRLGLIRKNVSFSNGENTLLGTIVMPATSGTHPAIIMLGGSDWTVRADVEDKARIFASMGLAVLIYDKRGNGESTGEPVCSFAESAADAVTGVNLLMQHPQIDASRVGVYGASRGGWMAPMVCNRARGVAFVVLFVAPAVSPARQEHTRRMNEIRANGFDAEQIKAAEDYLNTLWAATTSDENWDRYEKLRNESVDFKWYQYADGILSKNSSDYRWSRLNMHYDPIPELRQLDTPLLGLFGERDANVTPTDNLPKMENALRQAGNNDFELRVVPNANHGLRQVEGRDSETPFHLTTGYSPAVWSTVRAWLHSRKIIANP